jgi:hypothetical protein
MYRLLNNMNKCQILSTNYYIITMIIIIFYYCAFKFILKFVKTINL